MCSPARSSPLFRELRHFQLEGSGPVLLAQGLSNPKSRIWFARGNTLWKFTQREMELSHTKFSFQIEHLQTSGLHVLVAGGIELHVLDWRGVARCTLEYAIRILCGDRDRFAYCAKGSPDKIHLHKKLSAEFDRTLTLPHEVSHMTLCNQLLATHSANSGVTVWNIEDSPLCLYKIESPAVDQLFFLPDPAFLAIRNGHELISYKSAVLEKRVNVDSCSANPYAVCSLKRLDVDPASENPYAAYSLLELNNGSTQVSINGYSETIPGSFSASAATPDWFVLAAGNHVVVYSVDRPRRDCTIS